MKTLGSNAASSHDMGVAQNSRQTNRRFLLHNTFDFLAIAATCLIFAMLYFLIKPFQRGFFCDDQTIRYPYKPDTIPMWLLAVYGGVGPVIIFIIVETWVVRPIKCGRGSHNNIRQRRVDFAKTLFETIFLFLLGIAICFLITEVGKRTIGRLRPYYITICEPAWANIMCTETLMTAGGPINISRYVTDHSCRSNATVKDLQEAKLSFPSGHSSYSTYAFMFLFVYFEARLLCPMVQFLKPFLQCLCVAIAFFTCLSRVTDFKHHPTDVIGGAIIGFCIAIFAAVRVGTYLWTFSVYCETESETKKDRLPDDERVAIPGIDIRHNGALRTDDNSQIPNGRHKRLPCTTLATYNDGRINGKDSNVQYRTSAANPGSMETSRVSPAVGMDGPNY